MRSEASVTTTLQVAVVATAAVAEALASRRFTVWPISERLEVARHLFRPDVWVVDVSTGLDKLKALKTETPVLVLATQAQVAQAWEAGAAGVLDVDATAEELAAAVVAVDAGLSVFGRAFVSMLLPAEPHIPQAREKLTPRESEVLPLLADGLSNKQIAARLSFSEHTAKFHVNSILQKLGAQKRVEAVVRAARLGLLEL